MDSSENRGADGINGAKKEGTNDFSGEKVPGFAPHEGFAAEKTGGAVSTVF